MPAAPIEIEPVPGSALYFPTIIREERGWGFVEGEWVEKPYPESIRIKGWDRIRLVRFTDDFVGPLASVWLRYGHRLSGTIGKAEEAIVAVRQELQLGVPANPAWIRQAAMGPAREFVQRRIDGFKSGKHIGYALVDSRNEILGVLGAWPTTTSEQFRGHSWEIGFWIRPDYHGTQLAKYSVATLGSMIIDHLDARHIKIATDPTNIACIQLATKLGFEDEGVKSHFQEDRTPPHEDIAHVFSWTHPDFREPNPIVRAAASHRYTPRLGARFEPHKLIEDRVLEVSVNPERVNEILERTERELDAHFQNFHNKKNVEFYKATYLRAIATGAAARIWSFHALGLALRQPSYVLQNLRFPPQVHANEHFRGTYKNPSTQTFGFGSDEGEFITAVMKLFTTARIDKMENDPRLRDLFEACENTQARWIPAAQDVGKLDRYMPAKDPHRQSIESLRFGNVDVLGGTIMDAILTEMYLLAPLPEAVYKALNAAPGHNLDSFVRGVDGIQRAFLRSNDNLAGMLVSQHRNLFEDATGKGVRGQVRGPLRADELTIDFSGGFRWTVSMNNPKLPQGSDSGTGICPARGQFPACSKDEAADMAHLRDVERYFDCQSPSSLMFPLRMSTEYAVTFISALHAPLLWRRNSHMARLVGWEKSPSLVDRLDDELGVFFMQTRPFAETEISFGSPYSLAGAVATEWPRSHTLSVSLDLPEVCPI